MYFPPQGPGQGILCNGEASRAKVGRHEVGCQSYRKDVAEQGRRRGIEDRSQYPAGEALRVVHIKAKVARAPSYVGKYWWTGAECLLRTIGKH